MQRSRSEAVDVLIVLMSLVAEGTPQLALQLARQWQLEGLSVEVMVMQPEPLDLQAEFQELGLTLHWVDLGCGLARYWTLFCHSYSLCRRLRHDRRRGCRCINNSRRRWRLWFRPHDYSSSVISLNQPNRRPVPSPANPVAACC